MTRLRSITTWLHLAIRLDLRVTRLVFLIVGNLLTKNGFGFQRAKHFNSNFFTFVFDDTFMYYHSSMISVMDWFSLTKTRTPSRSQASFYNNFSASQNCVGGSEYGCGPGAIAPRAGIARIM